MALHASLPVALPAPPHPFAAREAVFVVERDGWFIGSGVIADAGRGDGFVRVRYCVPEDVEALFGASTPALYRSLSAGIDEDVAVTHVYAMSEFEAAPPDDGIVEGTIVVMLRPEPYRVVLGVVEAPVPAATDPKPVYAVRMLAPDRSLPGLTASGALTEAETGTFVSVTAYRKALESPATSELDLERHVYFRK